MFVGSPTMVVAAYVRSENLAMNERDRIDLQSLKHLTVGHNEEPTVTMSSSEAIPAVMSGRSTYLSDGCAYGLARCSPSIRRILASRSDAR